MRGLWIALVFASGCTLFEDKPDKSCKVSSDCFQAQGEICDTTKGVCVSGPDAQMTPATAAPEAPQ